MMTTTALAFLISFAVGCGFIFLVPVEDDEEVDFTNIYEHDTDKFECPWEEPE